MASQPNCVALACVLKHTDGFADEDTLGFTASAEMCLPFSPKLFCKPSTEVVPIEAHSLWQRHRVGQTKDIVPTWWSCVSWGRKEGICFKAALGKSTRDADWKTYRGFVFDFERLRRPTW